MKDKLYKNILWFAMAAVLIFSPIARGAVRPWSITPVLLISYFLIFLWFWKLNNQTRTQSLRPTPIDMPIIIFALLAFNSFAFSIYKHDSLYTLIKLFSYIGIYYLIVNEFDHTIRKRIIGVALWLGAGLSLYGLLQYFGLFGHSWWAPKEFLAATYVNHNHFAGYLELVLPALAGTLFNRKLMAKGQRLGHITYNVGLVIGLIVMVVAFVLTQSRGAWFSLSASSLFLAAVFIKKKAFTAKNIFILFLLFIIVFSFVYFTRETIYQRVESLSGRGGAEEISAQTRLMIWRGSMTMIMDRPFVGTGIGTFIWGFPRFRPFGLTVQANFAHNDYLQAAAEMGIIASFIMVWLLVLALKAALKRVSFDSVKCGCAIGVLSLALHGLVDFNFHIPANMLLFTVYLAILTTDSPSDREIG